jgi:hypothetical protein
MRPVPTVLVVSAIACVLAAEADARPRQPRSPYTGAWEHRCVELEWSKAMEVEEFANSMGLAGWELVGFPKPRIFCFKRRQIDPNSGEGMLRALNDRMMKLTEIYNSGRIDETEYRRRLEAIEVERTRVLGDPDAF